METEIIKPINPKLKTTIQYFIIFKSENNKETTYTTFPNTNLCLSLYNKNKIVVEEKKGSKHLLTMESEQRYKSYLSGFHDSNLHVTINTPIDEVCIIFHPGAVRLLSNIPYGDLIGSDEAFQMIFPKYDHLFLEQLFEEDDSHKRIAMLEHIILKSFTKEYLTDRIREALHTISNTHPIKVNNLAKELSINESTLYRLFINEIGQNPKSFLRTVRFRNALNEMIKYEKVSLTGVAYQNNFTDQSHFIHDFKGITGQTPNLLKSRMTVEQEELAWIYTQH